MKLKELLKYFALITWLVVTLAIGNYIGELIDAFNRCIFFILFMIYVVFSSWLVDRLLR